MIYYAIAAAVVLVLWGSLADAKGLPGNESTRDMVIRVAGEHGQEPALIVAICEKESSMNPLAQNPSDPSWGLMGIKANWMTYFGYTGDPSQLFDGEFNANLGCQIVGYFQSRGFSFPDQADIYNVGETLWRQGRRNIAYRDSIKRFYSNF